MGSIKQYIRKITRRLFEAAFVILIVISGINGWMYYGVKDHWIEDQKLSEALDCVLILGAGLRPDGTPSLMLEERLDEGIRLYREGLAKKLLMSGDHGKKYYDEVNAMRSYALAKGVPSEDIFMDHAGFSTYDSLYRAKAIFEVKKTVIVSQRYHLYRAFYIADRLKIEAYAAPADRRRYPGQNYREIREAAARAKDFFKVHLRMKPRYLGETIPISGDGNITDQ